MLSKKPRSCSQSYKNIPKNRTQISTLNQSEKRVRINDIVANVNNLEANNSKVIQNLITIL